MTLTREQYLDLIAIGYRAQSEAKERIEKHRQRDCETWFGEHMLARAALHRGAERLPTMRTIPAKTILVLNFSPNCSLMRRLGRFSPSRSPI